MAEGRTNRRKAQVGFRCCVLMYLTSKQQEKNKRVLKNVTCSHYPYPFLPHTKREERENMKIQEEVEFPWLLITLHHYSTCPCVDGCWLSPFLQHHIHYSLKPLWNSNSHIHQSHLCHSAAQSVSQRTPTTYFWSLSFKCFHCNSNYSDLLFNLQTNGLAVVVNFIW